MPVKKESRLWVCDLEHAMAIRRHVEEVGALKIVVVLSHYHNDHIAGNEVFADCEIIATNKTSVLLEAEKPRIATRAPIIDPVVPPNSLYTNQKRLNVGRRAIELHQFNIHSPDATVLWLPQDKLLLAGDTLEDPVTYFSDPADLPKHLKELNRLSRCPISRILPSHGDPVRIAMGGYEASFIEATSRYITAMASSVEEPTIWTQSLADAMSSHFANGDLTYFQPYERVHASNIKSLRAYRAAAAEA